MPKLCDIWCDTIIKLTTNDSGLITRQPCALYHTPAGQNTTVCRVDIGLLYSVNNKTVMEMVKDKFHWPIVNIITCHAIFKACSIVEQYRLNQPSIKSQSITKRFCAFETCFDIITNDHYHKQDHWNNPTRQSTCVNNRILK